MESIKEIFRIGKGPSSSHTMGPRKAAETYIEHFPDAHRFRVTLYGSLAATGRGHLTDAAIHEVLDSAGETQIVWDTESPTPVHPNTLAIAALDDEGQPHDEWTFYSVGGGAIKCEHLPEAEVEHIYPITTASDLLVWCDDTGRNLWEYVAEYDKPDIWDYLHTVWETMCAAIENGLSNEGVLPGGLGVKRKAATYLVKSNGYTASLNSRGKIYAYALAVSEENASGGTIVTAPTCGSCGVLPSVLFHLYKTRGFREIRILRAIATAGLFGNIVKTNASISGAEVGCQGEVGVACAMAAAAACQLFGGTPAQIEYAAEMALEHHLGLTCDPMCGLVQVPCIERNAVAAARALDANIYATYSDGRHRISFDRVVDVMRETGHDLPSLYKETSSGGLAKIDLKRHE